MTNKKNHKSMIKERNPSSKKRVQKLKKSRIKKSHRRENKKKSLKKGGALRTNLKPGISRVPILSFNSGLPTSNVPQANFNVFKFADPLLLPGISLQTEPEDEHGFDDTIEELYLNEDNTDELNTSTEASLISKDIENGQFNKEVQDIINEMLEIYGINVSNIKDIFLKMLTMLKNCISESFRKSWKIFRLIIKIYYLTSSKLTSSVPSVDGISGRLHKIGTSLVEKTGQFLNKGKEALQNSLAKVGNYIKKYFMENSELQSKISLFILIILVPILKESLCKYKHHNGWNIESWRKYFNIGDNFRNCVSKFPGVKSLGPLSVFIQQFTDLVATVIDSNVSIIFGIRNLFFKMCTKDKYDNSNRSNYGLVDEKYSLNSNIFDLAKYYEIKLISYKSKKESEELNLIKDKDCVIDSKVITYRGITIPKRHSDDMVRGIFNKGVSRYSPLRGFDILDILRGTNYANLVKYPHLSTSPLLTVAIWFSVHLDRIRDAVPQIYDEKGLIYVIDNQPNTCLNINKLIQKNIKFIDDFDFYCNNFALEFMRFNYISPIEIIGVFIFDFDKLLSHSEYGRQDIRFEKNPFYLDSFDCHSKKQEILTFLNVYSKESNKEVVLENHLKMMVDDYKQSEYKDEELIKHQNFFPDHFLNEPKVKEVPTVDDVPKVYDDEEYFFDYY